jgi:hypothetical protein
VTERPRIVLFALAAGFGGMHLPRSLHAAGFEVLFAGSPANAAAHSQYVAAHAKVELRAGTLAAQPLIDALRLWQPAWITPLDEAGAYVLRSLLAHAGSPTFFRQLLHRSLGASESLTPGRTRRDMHALATGLALEVPRQIEASSAAQVLQLAQDHGFPLVLKREQSSGGTGVAMISDGEDVARLDREGAFRPGNAIVQTHVAGRLGMHAVVAVAGNVLAGVSALQERARSKNGVSPTSVATLLYHAGMAASAERFAAACGASGFLGWDFILPPGDAPPVMIEVNPRPISISHLGAFVGQDLCASLHEYVTSGTAPRRAPRDDVRKCVALFPDEWLRDPSSPALQEAYHDVPWADEKLLRHVFQVLQRFSS